jgi:hypothetical protein
VLGRHELDPAAVRSLLRGVQHLYWRVMRDRELCELMQRGDLRRAAGWCRRVGAPGYEQWLAGAPTAALNLAVIDDTSAWVSGRMQEAEYLRRHGCV